MKKMNNLMSRPEKAVHLQSAAVISVKLEVAVILSKPNQWNHSRKHLKKVSFWWKVKIDPAPAQEGKQN